MVVILPGDNYDSPRQPMREGNAHRTKASDPSGYPPYPPLLPLQTYTKICPEGHICDNSKEHTGSLVTAVSMQLHAKQLKRSGARLDDLLCF